MKPTIQALCSMMKQYTLAIKLDDIHADLDNNAPHLSAFHLLYYTYDCTLCYVFKYHYNISKVLYLQF